MLADPLDDPGETTAEELLERYASGLAAVVDSVGGDRVIEGADVDPEAVAAIEAGAVDDLDLRDAAAVLALRAGSPDAATILAEVRDHLLLGMSTAMLSVDRVAADVEGNLDAKEVQGKLEGRHPMSVGEYARLRHLIVSRT